MGARRFETSPWAFTNHGAKTLYRSCKANMACLHVRSCVALTGILKRSKKASDQWSVECDANLKQQGKTHETP